MATVSARKKPQSLRSERIFFLSMMALIAVLVVWGFLPSFLLRSWVTPPASYIDRTDWMRWAFIGHGVLFMLWLGLFALQTVLIGSKRLPLHKQIGRSSYPLYLAIVAMGLFVGYLGARHGFHDVPFDSITFSALPWFVILAYAVLAWAGLNERKDPQRHKRLMLLATIALSDAGVARVALLQLLTPEWMSRTVLLIIPLILWDLATLRRVHRVTIWGGLLVAASLLLSVPIGMTKPWHAAVSALIGSDGVPTGQIAN